METKISETRAWLLNVVAGLGLCPFVSVGVNEPFLSAMKSVSEQEVLKSLDFLHSVDPASHLTYHCIHIYSECRLNFSGFYSVSKLMQDGFDKSGIEVEVVCFHPDFLFEGASALDRGNFVNRSPYPSLHLVSSALMKQALNGKEVNFGEKVSLRNNDVLEEMNSGDFREKVLKYSQGFWHY